ncbi:MAG TPA: hypothetical protein VNV44_05685 [Solirubrobacteraceae bacterium]|jgi:hypothetical protein|nr:hypothetical protein [Solirubrobacteraceae bacterium]
MATRTQVMQLLSDGHSYETAAAELGISAGEAFMVATGLPADGSGAPRPEERREVPQLPASSQHLSNPPAFNPTSSPAVLDWVRERAHAELSPPQP